jgi:drug/metabolite transporter (DMT)-like permease
VGALRIQLSIALLCLIWGSTWIVIQGGLQDLPALTAAAARFVLAAVVMTAAAPFLRAREGGADPPLWLSAVLGTGNFGLSYGIVYWSETQLPSGIVSVLWSVFPMLMALSGHLFLPGETLHGRQWAGFATGLMGVAVLFMTDLRRFGPQAIPAASILILSPLVSTVGTTIVKRRGSEVSSVLLNRDAMWIGALLLCGGAWFFERDLQVRWTVTAVLSVLYLAVAGTVVTFGLYFWILRHTAAHRLSLIAYVTPAVALLLGWAVGREPITAKTVAGSALILSGVSLVVRRRAQGA